MNFKNVQFALKGTVAKHISQSLHKTTMQMQSVFLSQQYPPHHWLSIQLILPLLLVFQSDLLVFLLRTSFSTAKHSGKLEITSIVQVRNNKFIWHFLFTNSTYSNSIHFCVTRYSFIQWRCVYCARLNTVATNAIFNKIRCYGLRQTCHSSFGSLVNTS